MDKYFSFEPEHITVITGPPNCGKTALVQEFMRRIKSQDFYINARTQVIDSPSSFSNVLKNAPCNFFIKTVAALGADPHSEAVHRWHAVKEADTDFSKNIELTNSVLQTMLTVITDGRQTNSRLILVIDAADMLKAWSKDHESDLQQVLAFFTSIATEQNICHVVLVTSDSTFDTWLSRRIGATNVHTHYIGNFTKKHAQDFLNKRLQQYGKPEVSAEDWEHVYLVCGGNAGALRQAAWAYTQAGNWKQALQLTMKQVLSDTDRLLRPCMNDTADGFTLQQFQRIRTALLESSNNAVDINTLSDTIAAESLVRHGLLSLRRDSPWAQDIEADAFGPHLCDTLVTARTPLHLHVVREINGHDGWHGREGSS